MSHYDSTSNPFYGGPSGAGGGYMSQNSPFGASQSSPGGFRKSGGSQALRPLTIRQINTAQQAHPDADYIVDNSEVSSLTVVGHVIEVSRQATNDSYIIEDGTGRIEARYWLDDAQREQERSNDIIEGSIVRVTGILKQFHQKRHISCQHIRAASADEISFHMLEAISVRLYYTRGPVSKGDPGKGVATTGAYSGGAAAGPSGGDPYRDLSELQRQIVRFIQSSATSSEGVYVAAIARAVNKITADHHEVGNALDQLLDEGHVYTTIDDSHFALS